MLTKNGLTFGVVCEKDVCSTRLKKLKLYDTHKRSSVPALQKIKIGH